MSNDVVIKSGRNIALGDTRAEIRDDGRPVHYVDMVMEARQGYGIVALAFGSIVTDANNDPLVQVASRLRMNLGVAQTLHKLLGDMISDALKPADKSQAN